MGNQSSIPLLRQLIWHIKEFFYFSLRVTEEYLASQNVSIQMLVTTCDLLLAKWFHIDPTESMLVNDKTHLTRDKILKSWILYSKESQGSLPKSGLSCPLMLFIFHLFASQAIQGTCMLNCMSNISRVRLRANVALYKLPNVRLWSAGHIISISFLISHFLQ